MFRLEKGKRNQIENATENLTIQVLPSDISFSSQKNHEHCAIAKACRRQFRPTDIKVALSRVFIRWGKGETWTRYSVPKYVVKEIIAFDRGGRFEPGTYELQAPTDSQMRRKPTGKGNTKGKKPSIRHMTLNVRAHLGGGGSGK